MSISTVDLKARRALHEWEIYASLLRADPSSESTFPRGYRDSRVADLASEAVFSCFSMRRKRDKDYFRAYFRQAIFACLSTPEGLAKILNWDLPGDACNVAAALIREYNNRGAAPSEGII